ncbi:MAG: hypothetical protein M0R37_03340 [Bacteroidales bacterium]|nr:hypothetical protein [Bacteroidales bacterium]
MTKTLSPYISINFSRTIEGAWVSVSKIDSECMDEDERKIILHAYIKKSPSILVRRALCHICINFRT